MIKTVIQKELRKNQRAQRHLYGKEDPESMRKLDLLMKEEKEILEKSECDEEKKGKRIRKLKEKDLLESMTFEETCEYFKSKDKDSVKEEHCIPNTREARIHRKKVIQGVQQYKMDQYFTEQIEMRRKLKAFLESIESED
tara:strand:- start:1389 stop:1808 length:420 start_codon:yes stop_codon:yes gene_type:complete